MGTRSLVGYTHKGITHYQYIQFDGYLSGRGAEFLDLLAKVGERTLKSVHHKLTPTQARSKSIAAMQAHMALMELESPHSWENNGQMLNEKFFTAETWGNYWVEFVRILDLDRNEAVFYGGHPDQVLLRISMKALAILATDASVRDLKEFVFGHMEALRCESETGEVPRLEAQTGTIKGEDWLVITLNGEPVVASRQAPEHLRASAQAWIQEAIERRHAERVKRAKDLVKDEPAEAVSQAVAPLAPAV